MCGYSVVWIRWCVDIVLCGYSGVWIEWCVDIVVCGYVLCGYSDVTANVVDKQLKFIDKIP